MNLFPEDSAERKTFPVYSGLLQYFPSALAAVANHSFKGNAKHNPNLPLHHDRAKSGDEADALVRHLMEGDLVGMAWRALAMLQKKLEANGAPVAPAARNAEPAPKPAKQHRVVMSAEIDRLTKASEYAASQPYRDRKGTLLLVGDEVIVADPTHDDVLCGFGKGSSAKIAGRSEDTMMVLVQAGHNIRWFNSKQLEYVQP